MSVEDAIVSYLCSGLHSIAVTEERAFGSLIKALNPQYKPLDSRSLSELLDTKKQAITNKLLETLIGIRTCSLFSESWSSANGHHYNTLTVRFIDPNWKLQNFVLKTLEILPGGTHGNHVFQISEELAYWKVMPEINLSKCSPQDKVDTPYIGADASHIKVTVAVTNDNQFVAPVFEALALTSLPCLATALSTSTEAGLDGTEAPMVSGLIAKARRLVSHFLTNVAPHGFGLCGKYEELVIDDNNRWKTTAKMIKHLLNLKAPINAVLVNHKERSIRELGLSPDEWYQLQGLLAAIKVISNGMKALDENKFQSCSIVAITLHRLKKEFTKICKHDTPIAFKFKTEVWDHLRSTYGDTKIQSLLNISAFLDPRFKDLVHLTGQQRDEVIQSVRKLILETSNGITGVPQQAESTQALPAKRLKLDAVLDDPEVSAKESGEKELDRYIKEEVIDELHVPLKWWRLNCQRFPAVANLARRYMSIPASALPVRYILYQDRCTSYNRRKHLMEDEVNDMVFLHKNLRLLQ